MAEYDYVYDGVRYFFANARHRDLFRANPEKYAPQFGGNCANNMANGQRRESLRLRRNRRRRPLPPGRPDGGAEGGRQLEDAEGVAELGSKPISSATPVYELTA